MRQGVYFVTTNWRDRNGHGTHVAGIVGAINNGLGVYGAMPGVRIMPVKVCVCGGGVRAGAQPKPTSVCGSQ
jgi:subtilisin family serine protease